MQIGYELESFLLVKKILKGRICVMRGKQGNRDRQKAHILFTLL